MTENLNLQRALLRSLRRYGTVEIADKVKVDEIVRGDVRDGAWPVVCASNGRRWRARLLVLSPFLSLPINLQSNFVFLGWSRWI